MEAPKKVPVILGKSHVGIIYSFFPFQRPSKLYWYRAPGLPNPGAVPNKQVLGFWVIGMVVQVLGKCMIIRYVDP